MANIISRNLLRIGGWIQNGIRRLPKNAVPKIRPSFFQVRHPLFVFLWRVRRKIGIPFFLILSLILGSWANDWMKADFLREWERTHLPSLKLIGHTVSSYGFKNVEELGRLHQGIRSLPANFDDLGSLWISTQPAWVAAFYASDSSPAVLFCRDCSQLPREWQPIGMGWNGLERLIEVLENLKRPDPGPVQGKRPKIIRDPREIVY